MTLARGLNLIVLVMVPKGEVFVLHTVAVSHNMVQVYVRVGDRGIV